MEEGQHVVAVAAMIFKGSELLCMRRSPDRDAGAGLWETLSGRVVHGEAPLAAVAREIEEECGLEVAIDPRPIETYAAQRRRQPMVVILYRARFVSGEVVRSVEHDDHAWLSIDEFDARTPLAPLVQAARRAIALPW